MSAAEWTEAIVRILNTAYFEASKEPTKSGGKIYEQESDEKASAERALTAVISEDDILKMLGRFFFINWQNFG